MGTPPTPELTIRQCSGSLPRRPVSNPRLHRRLSRYPGPCDPPHRLRSPSRSGLRLPDRAAARRGGWRLDSGGTAREFVDRTVGESKLGIKDVVEFFRSAAWIRYQSSKVFLKFCITGASGVFVNLGVFSVLLAAGTNKFVASPVAIECSIVTNFLLNNYWTFRWRNLVGPIRARGLRFNAVSIVSLAISYLTFVILSHVSPKVAPQVHQFIGIIPATLVNYFWNSYWTFRDGPPAGPAD